MRKIICITLLAASLFIFVSDASAAEPAPFATLRSGISVFAASDDEAGLEMWRSDGTPAGTFRLTDDACAEEHCDIYQTLFAGIVADNRAFFVVNDSNEGSALWVTNGSRNRTFPVYEGARIWNLTPPVWVRSLRLLFFVVVGDGSSSELELWRSDGTPEGTRKVRTFTSADSRGAISELTELQGRVFFNGRDPRTGGASLWSSDGTEDGTVLVRNFFLDFEGAGPTWLRAVGSRLLFFAPTANAGTVLWRSDGTRAGTRPIFTVQPGRNSYASVYDVRVTGSLLFFATSNHLWVSNGARQGTRVLGAFSGPPEPYLSRSALFNGRLYFEARTDEFGEEIWSTDGTPAGTRILADICPQVCSGVLPLLFPGAHRGNLKVLGNQLLFAATDEVRGLELWTSDGTAKGTRMVRDINPGFDGSAPGPVRVVDGKALFFTHFFPGGFNLWRTDGTSKGTIRISPPVEGGIVEGEIPGALLYRVWDHSGRDDLWVSNGTRSGTRLLKTFAVTLETR